MLVRRTVRVLLLTAFAFVLGVTAETPAQSKKKLGGPVVDLDGLKSQVYEHWKTQKAEKPNLYAFALPIDLKSDKDAADLVIYPITGKTEEIIDGWKKQFLPPSYAKSIDEVSRVEKFKAGKAAVTVLYTQGTYLKDAKKVENQRMRAYVVEVGDKKYAIRATGAFKSVGFHIGDLDAWVKNFK